MWQRGELFESCKQRGAVSQVAGAKVDHSLELVVKVFGHDFNSASSAADDGSGWVWGSWVHLFVDFWHDSELGKASGFDCKGSLKVLLVCRRETFFVGFNQGAEVLESRETQGCGFGGREALVAGGV